ncbi:MAG TPA: hypothetical protein DDW52_15495 [Planctomycetaceae bacterium]|nr:hypothetical protein [Planctomycetaceae bacterium]
MFSNPVVLKSRAVAWYFGRLGRSDLLARAGILLASVALCAFVLPTALMSGPSGLVLQSVALLVITELCVVSRLAWGMLEPGADHALGNLNVQPVSTRLFVYVRCSLVVGTSVLLFLVAAWLLRWAAMPDLPIAGPACCLVLLSSILNASFFAPATLAGRCVGLVGGISATFAWFGILYFLTGTQQPFLFVAGQVSFYPSPSMLALVAVASFIACTELCVWGATIQRRGDVWWIESFAAQMWASAVGLLQTTGLLVPSDLARGATAKSDLDKAFRSRWAAQAWYEYRTSGLRVVYFGGMVAVLLFAALSLTIWMNPQSKIDLVFWLIGIALSPLMFQLLAADAACGLKREGDVVSYSSFHGARPINNSQLLQVKLLLIAVHTLLGLVIVCSAACVFYSLFGWERVEVSPLLSSQLLENWHWWIAFVVMVAVPALFCLSAAMTLRLGFVIVNHPRLFWVIASVVYLHVIGVFVLNSHKWSYPEYWGPYFCALATMIVVWATWNIWVAFRSEFGGLPLQVFAVVVWLAIIPCAWIAPEAIRGLPWSVLFLAASVALVPLVAFVSLPGALAKLRHG